MQNGCYNHGHGTARCIFLKHTAHVHNARLIYCLCTRECTPLLNFISKISAAWATHRRNCCATQWHTRTGGFVAASVWSCLPQRVRHAKNSKEPPTNSTATCWPHNLQWQHTFTIAALAILRTAARNHVLSAYKHHLGTLSHSAHHYHFHTRAQKIHDHPLTY